MKGIDWEQVARETWQVLGPCVPGQPRASKEELLRVRAPDEIARMSLREWREKAGRYSYRDEEVAFLHRLARRLAGRTLRGRRRK
jgi:hypothetical protein